MEASKKSHILYVDDEVFNLKTFRAQFFREFAIHTAISGTEALQILDSEPIDLLVTDQRMPGMTGVELLGEVKKSNPQLLTIILTGFADIEVVKQAINKFGIFSYLNKPWDKDELKGVFERALEMKHLKQHNRQLLESLNKHNQHLEALVEARTSEVENQKQAILEQNEELRTKQEKIALQRDELSKQNELLKEAKNTIDYQNKRLMLYAKDLERLVAERTEQLSVANEELIRHVDQLQEFAFITAHNFRGPVASLQGLLNLLERSGLADMNQESNEIVLRLKGTIHQVHQVIEDINEVWLIKETTYRVKVEVFLADVIEKALETLGLVAKESHLTITTDFEAAPRVNVLPSYLSSVFFNLLNNSIKFRKAEEPPSVAVKSWVEQEKMIIQYEDNGLGIDLEKHRSKVFGMYQRFHSHVEGRGLGLFLVKARIEAMGGEIQIESQVGKGCTFIMILPVF